MPDPTQVGVGSEPLGVGGGLPVRQDRGCSRPSVPEPGGTEHHQTLDPATGALVVRLAWGLGDVLLSTSAIRRYKELRPETPVVYQTYRFNHTNRYHIEYPHGCPAEMLYGNPDIDQIIDWFDPAPVPHEAVHLRYAWFGGPSLDYPIQAHFWENLGLEWTPGQRFDAYYYPTDRDREWARERVGPPSPVLALTPHGGWPGKHWSDDCWAELIHFALREGMTPIVMAGNPLRGHPWDQRGVINLSGQMDIRQSAAILDLADYAVMIEGGLSNLRFALSKPVILLTCATQVGLQIWTPPELTTEIRMWEGKPTKDGSKGVEPAILPWSCEPFHHVLRKHGDEIGHPACEPCMWRAEHVKSQTPNVAPASTKTCPKGRSLRDVPANIVIEALKGA